jgi:bacillithiol system protein YtxJ
VAKVKELRTTADAEAMLRASHEHPVALFKHSIACPVSARGQGQFVRLEAEGDPPLFCVVVQYAREASTWIAETLGVRHETPQAMILYRGAPVLVLNHGRIRADDLRDASREVL